MKNLRSTVAAFVMMFVIAFGTTFANAGIIISAHDTKTGCESTATKSTFNTGIIISFVGIIISYTGIIISLKGDTASAPCGSTSAPTKEADRTQQNVGIIIS